MSYDLDKGIEGHTPLREYIIFPAQSRVLINGQLVDITSTILAFSDNHHWYTLGIDDKFTLDILKKTYPDLSELTIPIEFNSHSKLVMPTVADSQKSVVPALSGQ